MILLLKVGGILNVLSATTVTYHILTLPFDVKEKDNSTYKWKDVRVEALRCTSTEATIGLPEEFKSPLAQNFKYYRGVTCSHLNTMLYDNDGTGNKVQPLSVTYDIFVEADLPDAALLDLSSPVAAVDGEHIYVTYEYVGNNPGNILLLDGSQSYNIQLTNNRYLCLNRSRNNRPGAANAAALSAEDLASEDFVVPKAGTDADAIGFNWSTAADRGPAGICLRFKFIGEDPYNVTVMTAYEGTGTYTEKLAIEGTKYKKTYKGSTLFARLKSDGTSEKGWLSPDADKHYKSTSDENTFDSWQGFYRGDMNPIFNSVAVLPKGTNDYILVASKMNQNNHQYQPNSNGHYAFFSGDNANDPVLKFQAIDKIPTIIAYEIYTYTFKVKTPFGNILTATRDWSEAEASSSLKDHAPDALLRKYVSFTGAYAEKEVAGVKQADTSIPLSTFADADDHNRVIWLEYTTSMPFKTLPVDGDYDDVSADIYNSDNARWYTIRMNGATEAKNLVYLNSSSFSTGRGSNASGQLHQGENSAEAQFAFIGDPFELRIISRAASETAKANRYIGCATSSSEGTTMSPQTGSSDTCRWEIVPGSVSSPDYMILRQFNTTDKYIGWNSSASTVIYSGTASTIRVVELATKAYVYHIVRSGGSLAVKATAHQDIGVPLTLNNIPEIIRSPFIGSNNAFYWTIGDATATPSPTNKTNGSYELSSEYDVYVRYNSPITSYIDGDTYNVRLNGQYIYVDEDGVSIKSKSDPTTEELATAPYQWSLGGTDPYGMTVVNSGNEKYVTIADGDDVDTEPDWADGTITWSSTVPDSKFIIKSTSHDNVFEVMAATGDDFADAATTYYNIGRSEGNDVTKIYSNATYLHDSDPLYFQLTPLSAKAVTYHLIDKANYDLLQVVARQMSTDAPLFPNDYWSPLVSEYHYWSNSACTTPMGATIGEATTVYVTYDVSNQYDLQNKRITYLLKYKAGTPFRAEDGSDGLETTPVTPVYPYCNGDCCFFIYGQAQFNLQQEGAASTRTRWAWYLESANNDPYHVKICSRQQETYNQDDIRGYFATYQPDDYDKIVTTLVWPTISGIQGTEYMILGSSGNFRLVTTDEISLDSNHDGIPESRQRQRVKSFEQYWKTFDTVKKKILDGELHILEDKDKGNSKYEDPDGSPRVPTDPSSYRENLTGPSYNYHSYKKWAYAKRFNGYNKDGETKKGWEEYEHWFETIDMGEGYFTLEEVDINPVLILLDQHGWEIMRKPLPTNPNDPTKAAKYNQIRPYTSPMVEKYYFWTKASKRTGFHQYYSLSQQVSVNGEPFASQSLTDLPPYDTSTNIKDAKGNLLDQYVTYTVKDEYVQSYNSSTKVGAEFLIQQGSNYASYNGVALSTPDVPSPGGMQQYIIDNISNFGSEGSKYNDLWYVKPNARIDYEMGYVDGDEEHDIVTNHDWTDAEGYAGYTDYFSDGFDPYNIQISSVPYNTQYFVTNATGATLSEGAGSLIGVYSSDPAVSIREPETNIPCTWYDSRALAITNATFMAVQDANGNMQLMPRFDQSSRMKDFSELVPTTDAGIANTYTKIYRPLVYNYHIIDNGGHESLRYRSGGDLVPQTPDHFKSPLANDFIYYKGLTQTEGVYTEIPTKADISSKEITSSLAAAGLTTAGSVGNDVYVRYSYDKEADELSILQGKWLTMRLNSLDAQYLGTGTAGIYADDTGTPTKPATIDASAKKWQWKFLKTPQTDPDPYAVQLFNRNNPGSNNELPTTGKFFAILPHTSDGFALAEARTTNANYDTYNFLNGNGAMSSSSPATITRESGFLSTSCSFSGTNSQINLDNEVEHTFIYKIYTNNGAFAISESQDNATVVYNEYVPILPANIKTPLLNIDQFRYYNKDDVIFGTGDPVPTTDIASADTAGLSLSTLYGLYDDEVVVRYTAYDPLVTEYKVPNERNATGTGQVARANTSNDASIEINDDLLYNIVWFNDNMMVGDVVNNIITDGESQEISGAPAGKVWRFAGNDPYAIKIRQNGATKYVHKSGDATCDLSETASTFMLLPRSDNYEYGMFQITSGTQKLTGFGSTLTTGDAVPTKFIIFALSTHMVTYHLVIANINSSVVIPARDENDDLTTITIDGTTQRDLTNYPIADHAAGHVSLGDPLKVPEDMYRTNVDYFFYVGDIYNVDGSGNDNGVNADLTSEYKGDLVTAMGKDPNLVGKHVYINIVYSFQGGLPTNAGDGFVLNVNENKWYTFEAQKADGTPQLMQYTNAWGMEVKEGRGTHYTNDYLWSPIGDPYGFKMFHRYTYVNSGALNTGETNRVMTSSGSFTGDNIPVIMGSNTYSPDDPDHPDANSVYELLADENTNPGYFKIHPVANSSGDQYYFKIVRAHEDGDEDKPEHDYVRLSRDADYTQFTFGLSENLVKPYYDRHGYVGGLKDSEYNTTDEEKKAIVEALKEGRSLTSAQLMTAQKVVYNPLNIVKYTPGYYRLHSPEDIEGVTVRYASGYTHKTELTGGEGDTPIPMHFYERKGVNTTFEILGGGYTHSAATRGAIPISEPAYDPASIFRFYQVPSAISPDYHNNANMAIVSTQGLYAKGSKGPGNTEAVGERAAIVMTETETQATPLYIMDIGGGILLIHDQQTEGGRVNLKYLSFDQTVADSIYDLKLTHNTHTDYAKWLMEPANAQGLTLAAHSGFNASVYGETYYHTTFCAPFDVYISGDKGTAYTCVAGDSPWPTIEGPATTGELHPKPIGEYNTGTYNKDNKFVPAGTPVLIATTDNSGTVKLTIPTTAPSTPISTIFSGKYLEQLLTGTNVVYTFGLPFVSELTMNATTGEITGTLPQQAETGVGFYINANPNKELGLARAEWVRNNRYVIHNKIYYRDGSSGASAPSVQFVPVIFGDDEGGEEEPGGQEENENRNNRRVGDGCVYDLLGRKVASAAESSTGKIQFTRAFGTAKRAEIRAGD